MMEKKHIVFMGTPQIAASVLQGLLEMDQISVDLVVTQPDKKTGRKQIEVPCAVKQTALSNNIEVFQPVRVRADYQKIIDAKPDLIVTCAYGQFIPIELLEAPRLGCINLHGSLLPLYRGGAPIQRAIWDGHTKSGMSLMKMSEKMDAGPVMDQDVFEIEPEDTSSIVFEKMAQSAVRLLQKNLDTILSGNAVYIEQDPDKVSFAPVIEKEEELLDLEQADTRICNQIRALADTPGAYVRVKGKKLKILKASYQKEPSVFKEFSSPKKNTLVLGLHEGNLYLEKVQMEGKPVMQIKDFMNGQGRSLAGTNVE
jgi:methionyl-tRNA formyltransferase